MCGFAGIVTWDNRHRVHRDVLERMSARIAHRGPDDQGLWINHEEEATAERPQVGLAFRRLAIIDLDERANQPFTDGQGRWLVFNGEIYNYRELRKELESLLPDYRWRTQSDTEVLLASYAAWGEKCVEHLNGMFAFAIWNEVKQALFLARDRMGQKPLFIAYLQKGGRWARTLNHHLGDLGSPAAIAFGSELSALQAVPWFDASPDIGALGDYLRWGYCLTDETIYRGARALPHCHWMGVRAGGAGTAPYGGDRDGATDPGQAVERTRERVTTAVRRQLVADVPVGCFLSGGVDSSVIAAAMKASSGGQRILTFSIGFDDPRYDETPYARRVAEHLGTEHHEFRVRPDAASELPKLAEVFGEPFGDSSALPTHYLARETRAHVKVALSGDGGDELFGGYDRYRALQLARRLERMPGSRLLRAVVRAVPGSHPKSRRARAKRLIDSLDMKPHRRYASYLRLFDNGQIGALLREPFLDAAGRDHDVVADAFSALCDRVDDVIIATRLDREMYLPDDLLTKVDRCSMLHALEVRSPFMDPDLVRFASTLTTPQLLKGGPKRMLREAFADVLPAWVFKRKKMGFAVPIGEWFRGSLRPMLHDHLFAADSFAAAHFNTAVVRRLVEEHESQRTDHSQRLYALLMLELWWRTQRVQQTP
jgi:asparagine synthase (glutamine-hydrolysing)